MKSVFNTVIVFMCLILFVGCANKNSEILDRNYAAYIGAKQGQLDYVRQPMIDLELDENGKVKSLRVWKEPQIPVIEQIRPQPSHPGWRVLNSLVRVGGIIGGIWAAGDAVEGIVDSIPSSTSSSVTNVGSNNSAGYDYNGTTDISNSMNATSARDMGQGATMYGDPGANPNNSTGYVDNNTGNNTDAPIIYPLDIK